MSLAVATLDVPWVRLQATFVAFSKQTFFHLAGAMFGTLKSHRDKLLAESTADIDRHGGQGLRIQNISSRESTKPRGFTGTRSVEYRLRPRSWKWKPGQTLEDIEAESYTYSIVALGLETGGKFKARRSRFLALNIGATLRPDGVKVPRWSTPRKFLRGPEKETLTLPQKGHPENRIIWWNRAESRKKSAPKRWVPVFLLVPKINRKARLGYIKAWDALKQDRTRRFRKMLGNITRDIARGKP